MAVLYRPRGKYKRTGRDAWISRIWYRSRKDAWCAIDAFGTRRNHTNIRIIKSAASGTYKGKHIKQNQIESEVIHIRL